MLTRVEVTSFRAVGPQGLTLPLKPLTLIVGENGSGKSSILQALAVTAQSATEQPRLQDLVTDGTRWSGGEPASVYYQNNPAIVSDPSNPMRLFLIGPEPDRHRIVSARSSNNGADWITAYRLFLGER